MDGAVAIDGGSPPAVDAAAGSEGAIVLAPGFDPRDAGHADAPEQDADAGPWCSGATVACVDRAECCEGLSCDTTTLGRVCCGEEGARCTTVNGEDCCRDLLCIDGACGLPRLPDATCQPACLPVTWLADVLRAAGLRVWEDPSWRWHGHASFTDLWGVMAHHTGVNRDTEWMTVRDGTAALSGPLSQLVLEQDGLYRVVASGVAWHAGAGWYPGIPDNRANFHTLGIEAVNTGTEGWPAAQYEAYVLGVAAILRYLGHDSSRVIGHKEWAGASQGKWDPGGIDMNGFRADVQAILDE